MIHFWDNFTVYHTEKHIFKVVFIGSPSRWHYTKNRKIRDCSAMHVHSINLRLVADAWPQILCTPNQVIWIFILWRYIAPHSRISLLSSSCGTLLSDIVPSDQNVPVISEKPADVQSAKPLYFTLVALFLTFPYSFVCCTTSSFDLNNCSCESLTPGDFYYFFAKSMSLEKWFLIQIVISHCRGYVSLICQKFYKHPDSVPNMSQKEPKTRKTALLAANDMKTSLPSRNLSWIIVQFAFAG